MKDLTFLLFGNTAAIQHAGDFLIQKGYAVCQAPSEEVTHLLLPVPSFDENGHVRSGGDLMEILPLLPENITVFGGNLQHPALNQISCADFLRDAQYLAENAAITADCALRILGNNLSVVFSDCPMLILGWGRIGKCLGAMLKALGAEVTVFARKETDRATALSLKYHVISSENMLLQLPKYRAIINTVPFPMLSAVQTQICRKDCIFLDLASTQGILDERTIWARGLPNRDAPESSGLLIANTAIRLATQKEAIL